ncbi:hypothetical protein [Gordonia tangerina]|uniref:Lipoprotein n=1 Tax=Gordonia tangerina TaxID=2911060 RepID=A0ABS9DN63_9ACTN|nr:hypothetical protein [Gordonia tangerina]MCF3940647.1 hypothetical protein [Gordonia tangerina]
MNTSQPLRTPPAMMTRRRIAAALLAGGAVVALASCSASDDTSTSPPTSTTPPAASSLPPGMQPGPTDQPRPCPTGQLCTADQVIVAALEEVFSYRGTDPDPAAAAADRAADLLTPSYRAAAAGSWSMLAPITGSQWAQWKAIRATVEASARVLSDEHPPDTAATAARVATVTQTVTPTGEQLAPMTVWVVARAGGPTGWQLDTITTQQ